MVVRGIDFSGAAEPGEDIWITEGRLDGRTLELTACRSAAEAFETRGREAILSSLVDLLRSSTGTTGIDVSLGLPAALLPDGVAEWPDAVRWFAETFADADASEMREYLKERARASDESGVELKRQADTAVGANSPYGFITYYQTLHGIRDVLAPLVAEDAVRVPPMQSAGKRNVIETYPAGTLRRLRTVDTQYKESGEETVDRRAEILRVLKSDRGDIVLSLDEETREIALQSPGADALDSIVAAVATARAVRNDFATDYDYRDCEGYIYS
ncbi:DUF429 domain-containing protein [Natronomonas halophila]|uniref:DUF429 domain-containing protein n=1 Tax=Natronomonas halophila TaxID=2747817 RepID=UPI0015B39E8B|nr:DUF429 domain-containing protein [Natronomonas halophila]QLD86278.1 DUF429 domain-containing protein [Natronomonas halophila]